MTGQFEVPQALRGFGSPVGVYPPKAGSGRAGYLSLAAVMSVLAGLTVIGIVNPPAQNPPPPEAFFALLAVFGALALACFAMGFYSSDSTMLILFPDGLARTAGDKYEIFRWSDIREIYEYIHPVAGKHKLVTRDGRKIEIGAGVKDAKRLGETLQRTLVERMLPDATKAFDAGETLSFGPLRINHASLLHKDKRIGWEEIGKMRLLYNAYTRSLQFEVRNHSGFRPWCTVRTQDIPNLNVFKMLAERKKTFTS